MCDDFHGVEMFLHSQGTAQWGLGGGGGQQHHTHDNFHVTIRRGVLRPKHKFACLKLASNLGPLCKVSIVA